MKETSKWWYARVRMPEGIQRFPLTRKTGGFEERLADVCVDGVQREAWYPSPGMQCRWCEFRSRCRAWNGERQAA